MTMKIGWDVNSMKKPNIRKQQGQMSKPKVRGKKNKSHVHGFWPLTDFLLDLSSTVKDYMVTKFQGQRSKAKVTGTKNASYLFLEKKTTFYSSELGF